MSDTSQSSTAGFVGLVRPLPRSLADGGQRTRNWSNTVITSMFVSCNSTSHKQQRPQSMSPLWLVSHPPEDVIMIQSQVSQNTRGCWMFGQWFAYTSGQTAQASLSAWSSANQDSAVIKSEALQWAVLATNVFSSTLHRSNMTAPEWIGFAVRLRFGDASVVLPIAARLASRRYDRPA